MKHHVTTYDELADALKECREELEALLDDKVADYKDTEKLLLKLDVLYAGLKPRKRGK